MDVVDTGIKGLTLVIDDYRATYTKNGNEFETNGEYDCGEAWLNGEWFSYERLDNGTVVLEDKDGVERYTFEDSEDGWAEFADSVL